MRKSEKKPKTEILAAKCHCAGRKRYKKTPEENSSGVLTEMSIENQTKKRVKEIRYSIEPIVVQALGLLVLVSCMHYCTSTSSLSNS